MEGGMRFFDREEKIRKLRAIRERMAAPPLGRVAVRRRADSGVRWSEWWGEHSV
jgi:hypothetical protein